MMKIGVGYRRPLSAWIESNPSGVDCLEITAEHFFHEREAHLVALAKQYPLFVHGLGLSLGTPGPLDQRHLDQFARVVRLTNPAWVSEHVAFTRTSEADLGHLNPVPPTREMLEIIADHVREIAERCGKPVLLENITSQVPLTGEWREAEFLNRICERADCGLLLDVTNLFINSRNHGFDPLDWLRAMDPRRIRQLHLVGYTRSGKRYADSHAEPIQEELIDLALAVVAYAPVEALILERDADFPDAAGLADEIAKLQRIRGGH